MDLGIWVLTDSDAAADWDWARWLPHTRPRTPEQPFTLIGNDPRSVARRIAELAALIAARHEALKQSPGARLGDPELLVLLDGARKLRALPGMLQVLTDGPVVGVYPVCLEGQRGMLPVECQAVVELEPGGSATVTQERAHPVTAVRPDLVSAKWAGRLARALAPIRDISPQEDQTAIPDSCRLLDLLGLEPPTAQAVAERWARSPASTEALVGAGFDAAPFTLDLRQDGPHGLIAGTTGAGKSELLQTLVASLAAANRPDAMTFVLIDYKGGSAFKDCARLPHTVGMVTDLGPALVERALESLGAELRRREHILADAAAKDLEDYTAQRRRTPNLAPLPRLLIVIDEFASLIRELPDFITGLVSIAQRGRSLGIHLILATQRPAGAVSPEIRANTNLRIALRMTDAAESQDVIDTPEAARIPKHLPGRAYARLGHATILPFQAARIAAPRPDT
ncbi:FtsK/SpoIIIE domain-containing protein, partial [Actinocrinis puniceicyclus]|uniref:FtsK/SpoIIIE domain-containing protein n=1 Tax=Actinocrinis puniceicyclus TaxID=977794 RepID=UPI0034D9543B